MGNTATGRKSKHGCFQHKLASSFVLVCVGVFVCSSPSAQEVRLRTTLKKHADDVLCVAFSPDGTTLATVGCDIISLWNVTPAEK